MEVVFDHFLVRKNCAKKDGLTRFGGVSSRILLALLSAARTSVRDGELPTGIHKIFLLRDNMRPVREMQA